LRPLTDICPKPLLPVLNRPLLGLVLAQLEAAGCVQAAVNTHHLADQVHDFLRSEPWGFLLSVSHEPEILGTGGGLRQLGEVLREGPFLAINADILTDLDLAEVYRAHRPGAVSTLVLHDCPAYNNVWVAGGAVVSIGSPPPRGGGGAPPLRRERPARNQIVDLEHRQGPAGEDRVDPGQRLGRRRLDGEDPGRPALRPRRTATGGGSSSHLPRGCT